MIVPHLTSFAFGFIAIGMAAGAFVVRHRQARLSGMLIGLSYFSLAAALGVEIRISELERRRGFHEDVAVLRGVVAQFVALPTIVPPRERDQTVVLANAMLHHVESSRRDHDLPSKIIALLLLVAGGFKLGGAVAPTDSSAGRPQRKTDNANNAASAAAMGEHP